MKFVRYTLFALLCATAGCARLKTPPQPQLGATKVPAAWSDTATNTPVLDGWLAAFGDSQLTNLVAEALTNNADLEASVARVEQALANARAAGAALWPTLDLNAGGQGAFRLERSASEKADGVRARTGGVGAALDLSWEVDLWGRLRSERAAAAANASATEMDHVAARRSLAAQVAKAWFAAAEARLQRQLAENFVATYQETYRIVDVRFRAGAVTEQDVANAKADLALARQRARAANTTFSQTVRTLEILLGRYPSAELQVANDLVAVRDTVPAGLPSELLERRPDLLAAERRVATAFHLAEGARSARLPRLALTSRIGTASSALSELLDPQSAAANFAANLFAPLFDAGLRRAQFEQAQAQQREIMAEYRSIALRAFREVEDLLQSEGSLAMEEQELRDAVQQYETARRLAEARYKAGDIDLTDVLTIQRQELQAKSSLLAIRNQRLAQRINLHLALGGDFVTVHAAELSSVP